MRIKILLLALVCALLDFISISAKADAIYVGAWSKHIKPASSVNNEDHKMVGVEYGGYMVSRFVNSFGSTTVAVAKRYELFEKDNFKAGVYIGVTYGYRGSCTQTGGERTDDKVFCPLVVPEIVYTKYRTQIAVSLLGNAVAIGPRWEF